MVIWIDEKLAVTPMPSDAELEDLAGCFKAVAVLVETGELEYDLQAWARFGVKVKHLPIPDFGTPSLAELRELADWITTETVNGSAVLVHCYAGIGRSGMVAAAYLVAKGCAVNAAIEHVKGRVHYALEHPEQVELVRQLARI
ncbi:MAG TPA: protein tyrosine phosphatase [Methanomicrobia archaeon]|nr:protein tyrosine phosphatase [Methanomicrobia archaeon]